MPLIVVAMLAGAAYIIVGHGGISLEALVRHRMAIDAFVTEHRVPAILAYIALYIAAVALSVPGAVFLTVTGGFLFGLAVGASAAVIGATIGATLIFLVARTALGEPLLRRAGPRAAQLAQGFRDDAFSYLLFLRLVPAFPFFLVNLVPAFAGVRLVPFVGATALGVIPGALVYAFAGTGLDSVIAAQKDANAFAWPPGRGDCRHDLRCEGRADAAAAWRADRAWLACFGAGGGEKDCARAHARRCEICTHSAGTSFNGMTETLKPDICVIGGGSGGLSVAAAAAAFGVSVVLIENHKMGGDCLNTGCVPSKALLAAAKRAETMRAAAPFGVTAQAVNVDFAKVHDHVQRVIGAIAPIDSAERFTGLGVRVIKGQARFKDRRTVAVGDDYEIRARRFVIATGSAPALPAIPGLDEGPYLTNETVFDLIERPDSLIIIGAGPIGLEMAQAFRRLGSEVTVLEAITPLAKDDPECAAIVLDQLEREGVVIRSGVKVARVKHASGRAAVTFAGASGEETVEGRFVLVAAGRKPTTDGLELDAAGIKYDRSGILVNKKLKTANRRVYAIGDVAAGQLQFTHAANYHAGLVIRNALFRLPVRVNDDAIPWVTYTEPELAQIGLTEAQARQRGIKLRILRWPYHDNDRAQAERETHGHIKVITTNKGQILGATIVGAQAGELIAMWTLAIAQRA